MEQLPPQNELCAAFLRWEHCSSKNYRNQTAWPAGHAVFCCIKRDDAPKSVFSASIKARILTTAKEAIPTGDKHLIHALKNDDTAALSQIIDKYTNYVATVVYNQLGAFASPEDTEELTANVFVSLWEHRARLKTPHLRGWLAATARNEARRHLRSKKLLTVSPEDAVLVSDDIAQKLTEDRERTRFIQKALFDLGWPDREIFLRYYYYNQKIPEIADEMDMNAETVKSRLRRGREKLKHRIEEGDYYDGI